MTGWWFCSLLYPQSQAHGKCLLSACPQLYALAFFPLCSISYSCISCYSVYIDEICPSFFYTGGKQVHNKKREKQIKQPQRHHSPSSAYNSMALPTFPPHQRQARWGWQPKMLLLRSRFALRKPSSQAVPRDCVTFQACG